MTMGQGRHTSTILLPICIVNQLGHVSATWYWPIPRTSFGWRNMLLLVGVILSLLCPFISLSFSFCFFIPDIFKLCWCSELPTQPVVPTQFDEEKCCWALEPWSHAEWNISSSRLDWSDATVWQLAVYVGTSLRSLCAYFHGSIYFMVRDLYAISMFVKKHTHHNL